MTSESVFIPLYKSFLKVGRRDFGQRVAAKQASLQGYSFQGDFLWLYDCCLQTRNDRTANVYGNLLAIIRCQNGQWGDYNEAQCQLQSAQRSGFNSAALRILTLGTQPTTEVAVRPASVDTPGECTCLMRSHRSVLDF